MKTKFLVLTAAATCPVHLALSLISVKVAY